MHLAGVCHGCVTKTAGYVAAMLCCRHCYHGMLCCRHCVSGLRRVCIAVPCAVRGALSRATRFVRSDLHFNVLTTAGAGGTTTVIDYDQSRFFRTGADDHNDDHTDECGDSGCLHTHSPQQCTFVVAAIC